MQTCDSCGDDSTMLTEVVRLYITPKAWDTEENIREAAETEAWCLTCLVHYPHRLAEVS